MNDWIQECIQVGCVPAARWPYAGVCLPGGSAPEGAGGMSAWGVSTPRGCLLPGGVCFRGVFAPWGVCSGGGGVCSQGCLVSQHALRQTPLPLRAESQMPVKTLPWPNFVAASKYYFPRVRPRLHIPSISPFWYRVKMDSMQSYNKA